MLNVLSASHRFARRLVRAATICSAALLLWPVSAQGQTSSWQRPPLTSGDWFTAANWNGGVPTASRLARIDNGGTAVVNTGSAAANALRVGFDGTGYLEQYGGQVIVGNGSSSLGQLANSFGKYRIHDGLLTVGRSFAIGALGTGEFSQFGGSVRLELDLYSLGTTATGKGTYNLVDGTFFVQNDLTVGNFGEGRFIQSGGASTVGQLVIAATSSGKGEYGLHAGTLITERTDLGDGTSHFLHGPATHTSGSVWLGSSGMGSSSLYEMTDAASKLVTRGVLVSGYENATFTQWAGTTEISELLSVKSSKSATFNLHGGTLSTKYASIGGIGNGTFNQTAGSHKVSEILFVGESANSNLYRSEYNLSGGSLEVMGDAYVAYRYITSNVGVFTQTGGSSHIHGNLIIGDAGDGTYSISDGQLTVDGDVRVGLQASAFKTFEINGGLGQIDVGGDFILGPFGSQPLHRPVIEWNLDGTGISSIDAGGTAQIDGGRLLFTFGPDFVPTLGQEFLLISADGGIFGTPIYSGLGTLGDQWDIVRTANTLTLVSLVPEPGTMLLAGLGCVSFVIRGVRRRVRRGVASLTVTGN